MAKQLLTIIESPTHPNFSGLYQSLGYSEDKVNSSRKAISHLKTTPPDVIVAEFFYGYGNNYAGVNISNLDVMLFSLQRYAPDARVIVLVDKEEAQHVKKLNKIFPLHAVLIQPVSAQAIQEVLEKT